MEALTIQLKRLGKKKVKQFPLTFESTPKTLKELLEACVKNQVEAFNKKRLEVNVVGFLSPTEIQEQAESGKVGEDCKKKSNFAVDFRIIYVDFKIIKKIVTLTPL